MARTHTSGTEPTTSRNNDQIVTEIQTRATAANTFEFSNFGPAASAVSINCTNNSSCSGTVPSVDMLTFSLTGIEDLSLVDSTGLVGFDSNTEVVMEHRGVTLIQSEAAAGQNDGTHLTFQTYGGWLTNSVFGVEILDVREGTTTTNRYASFSFGNATGGNPQFTPDQQRTQGANLRWNGVMVGTNTETGHILHGDVLVDYVNTDLAVLDLIRFSNVKNLNNGEDVTFGTGPNNDRLAFTNITLTNGSFESTSGDFIKGSFFGNGHAEIGGIFNSSTHNILGAFGAVEP